jgi:hypothetical protein
VSDETILSVDVECDGWLPGRHSMRSFGVVAGRDRNELGAFYRLLKPLPGAEEDPSTMDWWRRQGPAYTELFGDPSQWRDPQQAIAEFVAWVRGFPHPVFFASPAGFDFVWLKYYLLRFAGRDSLWHNCMDLRSVAWGLRGRYGGPLKNELKKMGLGSRRPHTHHALDDAREQLDLFWNLADTYQRTEKA